MSENLVIGACDWRHKHWSKSFYPEELPADWCLGFYSNEFETVLVPSSRWSDNSGYRCEGWLDEVNESFRFYVELPPVLSEQETGQEQFIDDMNLLEDALGGIILTTESDPGTSARHVSGARASESRVSEPWPPEPWAWLSDALPDIPQLSPLAAAKGYQCYRNDDRGIALVRLYHDLVDKRAARMLLEQALQAGCEGAHICIADSDILRASDLSQMRQVIEIMGL